MYGQNINVSQPVTTYSIYGYVLALYTYGPVNIGMRLRVGGGEDVRRKEFEVYGVKSTFTYMSSAYVELTRKPTLAWTITN